VTPPPLPYTIRPLGVRLAVIGLLAALTAVIVAVAVAFGPEIRAQFTTFQRATLVVLGGLVLVCGHALARSRIVVRESGLRVVNGYRSRELGWGEVSAVRMRRGAPWASIEHPDGEVTSLLAIQHTDGTRAEDAVLGLRAVARARQATP